MAPSLCAVLRRLAGHCEVRKRWRTQTVLAEDCGDYVVLRPVPDDPVAAAAGAFATQIRALGSEEAKRLDRQEELDAQERDGR